MSKVSFHLGCGHALPLHVTLALGGGGGYAKGRGWAMALNHSVVLEKLVPQPPLSAEGACENFWSFFKLFIGKVTQNWNDPPEGGGVVSDCFFFPGVIGWFF